MTDLPPLARTVRPAGSWAAAADRVLLAHDARRVRRARMTTAAGASLLVDLPAEAELVPGDALELDDGRLVAVEAAEEPLVGVCGADLARLAWHLGCQRVPCRIGAGEILLPADEAVAAMLVALGGEVRHLSAPFLPDAVPGQPAADDPGDGVVRRHEHVLRAAREHHFRRVHAHAVHHQAASDLAPEVGDDPD